MATMPDVRLQVGVEPQGSNTRSENLMVYAPLRVRLLHIEGSTVLRILEDREAVVVRVEEDHEDVSLYYMNANKSGSEN